MLPNEVVVGTPQTLKFDVTYAPSHVSSKLVGRTARISPGTSEVYVEDEVWSVRPSDRVTERALPELLRPGVSLCWIARVQEGSPARIEIRARSYPEPLTLQEDPVSVGLDDRAYEEIRSRVRDSRMKDEEARAWANEEFVIEDGSWPPRMLIAWGWGEVDRDKLDAFTLVGRTHQAHVHRDSRGRLLVSQIRQHNRSDVNLPPIGILEAPAIAFTDCTVATELARLNVIDPGEWGSYLRLWHSYNMADLRLAIRQAQALGPLAYYAVESEGDGSWAFRLHLHATDDTQSRWEALDGSGDPAFEASTDLPPYLERLEATDVEEYIHTLRSDAKGRRSPWTGVPAERRPDWATGRVFLRHVNKGHRPPKEGYVFLSLRGDITQIARRSGARERIAGRANPMPQLAALIEGRNVPSSRSRIGGKHLCQQARDCFGGEPTKTQRRALRVAVETPDIALIQGPPGTGKTRLIAAIQAQLAHLAHESHWVSGQVLITSAQHDAVENAAGETLVHGLPAMKIGQRFGERWRLQPHVAEWAKNQASKVKAAIEAHRGGAILSAIKRVRTCAALYRLAPGTPTEAEVLLEKAYDAAVPYLTAAELDELKAAAAEVRAQHAASQWEPELLEAIEGIPVERFPCTLEGRLAARRVLRRLPADSVPAEDLFLLQQVANMDTVAPSDVVALKRRLEWRFRLDQHATCLAVDTALQTTLNRLIDQAHLSTDAVSAALTELLHGLVHEPHEVERALRQYTVSLASTCSQAGGQGMADAKGSALTESANSTDWHPRVVFDTVVIDEAARANPLDLFIPMAMARQRIILVGDQNQLPQLLEPEVEAEIERSEVRTDADDRERRKQSLFGLLFRRLKELEDRDGIKRSITLDAQYRMHEVLGRFVSDSFYPNTNINSPRGADGFAHALPGYRDACAAWIDVPYTQRDEEKGRWTRPAEAARVAKEVARLLRAPEGRSLKFGVITFYGQQVGAIERAIEKAGVWSSTEEGYALNADFAGDGVSPEKRLEVGTVDAFQGKQHDVVILSTVRSNRIRLAGEGPGGTPDDYFERSARRKYGFLTLPNRLCVAMSRQQRLLIVVGDSTMLRGQRARLAVPALASFYDLTGGPHGYRTS